MKMTKEEGKKIVKKALKATKKIVPSPIKKVRIYGTNKQKTKQNKI